MVIILIQMISVGEDVKKLETSYTAGGNTKLSSYFAKQFIGFSKS